MKKNISHFIYIIAMAFIAMSFSSCATIISGSTAKISLDGSVDEPVTISSSYGVYEDVRLPTTVEVKRKHLDGQRIKISSEHYAYKDIVLRKSLNYWSILSAYIYALPLGVDLLTNAVSKPRQKDFFIVPLKTQQEADSLNRIDSLRMVAEKETRERAKILPSKYPRHEIVGSFGFGPNQADKDQRAMNQECYHHYPIEREGECFDIIGQSYLTTHIEYHYRLNRKWDLGAIMGWGVSKEIYGSYFYYDRPILPSTEEDDVYSYGRHVYRSFTVAPSVRFTWHERKQYRLYSRVALGLLRHHLTYRYYEDICDDYENYKYTTVHQESIDHLKWRMGYQVSPLCMSAGSDHFRFFGELGYGCLGVFNLGLCISF